MNKIKSFPLVSIVIPVYNGSNYLGEAIDSALAQTYKNIEILVVNDGSKDENKTKSIALSYQDKITYYEKANGGVASALNLAIEKMNGEYFSWLSHDDKYYSNKIEKQIDFLFQNKFENVLLYSDITIIDEDSNVLYNYPYPHYEPENFRPAFIKDGLINGCTLLIPKICFDTCGVFNIALKTTQDYDLWFRFSEKFDFIHLPNLLVFSRIHDNQDTVKLKNTVFKEKDNLHTYFIQNLSREEVIRFSNGNIAAYFIAFANKMNSLGCYHARKYAINKAFSNLFESNPLKIITNTIHLSKFLILINGRKIINFIKNKKSF